MNGTELRLRAAERAAALPAAALEYPFGPDHEVYKVGGKVFFLATTLRGQEIVTLKAGPADAQVLQRAFADITPGYHMNKRHWITVHPDGALEHEMLVDLITESYLLVVETLPRARRPVNPETFGQGDIAPRSPQE